MNGLCPACRRPYNDETIEWKVISPEEFKADLQKQARKKAEIRQKEAQKREAESLNRKHLAGLRVVQKNLVYVVGLSPRIREEDLLNTLRGPQYFGQYGKIVKIVVSKSKDGGQGGHQPMGVYVTFAKKEDAERCIAAVDGSENGGHILRLLPSCSSLLELLIVFPSRAQYGTTKYCSAYLRNETCTNKSCMFLHEPGEEKDSFTRQDLSSINVVSTQRPAHAPSNLSSSTTQVANRQAQSRNTTPHPQPLAAHPTTSDSHTMGRELSKEGISPSDGGDGSALPSSASWATRGVQQQSRRASQVASTSSPSPQGAPAVLGPKPVAAATDTQQEEQAAKASSAPAPESVPDQSPQDEDAMATQLSRLLDRLLKSAVSPHIRFTLATDLFSPEEYEALMRFPLLIDVNGGAKLRARKDAEAQRKADELAKTISRAAANTGSEDAPGSGSLQLGGEPEAPQDRRTSSAVMDLGEIGGQDQQHQPIQPPAQHPLSSVTTQDATFGQNYASGKMLASLLGNGRGLTAPEQTPQHQLPLKVGHAQPTAFFDQFVPGASQSQQPQPEQLQQVQEASLQGHARQTSRFAFANESGASSATVKPAANAKILAQQAAMMPNTTANHSNVAQTHQQYAGSQYYGGAIPIPPPGLKSRGATPTSGGGLFGHGQAFPSSFVGGPNMAGTVGAVDNKPELLRELIRTRGALAGATGNGHGAETAKRELMSPFLSHFPSGSTPAPAPSLVGTPFGLQPAAYQDYGLQNQKKKGKKHRQANTSSIGGGGIVDLADPSILHARMQPQNGAGLGQGLYSGQSQGGFNPAGATYGGAINRW
ncbi:MAG: transcriptional repressor general negative regulator of transcription subunit 4 [Peltula sp. TS41687]|nr:MAG: transcriptional repressor general negative regulator of transcription subunit 4 [Peltula sp. TS41687]